MTTRRGVLPKDAWGGLEQGGTGATDWAGYGVPEI